jgi:acyl-CoA thioesterase
MISKITWKEQALIEDVIAQNHILVDSLTFSQGMLAKSVLQTIGETSQQAGSFAQLLGINFEEMAGGRCTASLQVKQHLLNPHGIAHGGVTFSLADSVCGGAALSTLGEPRILTQDMQIRYHGPARTGTITASAQVIHHGQRTITVQGKVRQNAILIASMTATFAILAPAEMPWLGRSSEGRQ